MKPARGSSRSSTRGPKAKVRGERRLPQTGKKPLPSGRKTQDKSRKNNLPAEVQKGREKWKPLEKSSIVALDTMLSMSILTALTLRRKEKEESQKHLNLLKEQFLAKCSQLPVPVKKCGNMVQMSRQFQAESQKLKQGKSEIEAFEGSIGVVVGRLEQLQQEMDILEGKCRVMRARMAEEEERAQEIFQLAEQTVLRLPAVPPQPDGELSVQEQMLKMVSNPKVVMKVLQSKVTGTVRAFLELAHKHTDRLMTHPATTNTEDIVL
ncbi:centromere protein Q isoform X1 [Electrophorus electricus]|uniref:centromere protein Q isoform X1 n=1 Tax=Electrophorus electricus TaxID=8005 RepID=UPI0015D0A2CB|nr:centromere protein Q isoform X1 [Electrophorus electricus]